MAIDLKGAGRTLKTEPLVHESTTNDGGPTGVEQTKAKGPDLATEQVRTAVGNVATPQEVHGVYSADPLVASGLLEATAFALEGAARDFAAYEKDPSLVRLKKLNRTLEHAAKEIGVARESRDVQLQRFKGAVDTPLERIDAAYVSLLSIFERASLMNAQEPPPEAAKEPPKEAPPAPAPKFPWLAAILPSLFAPADNATQVATNDVSEVPDKSRMEAQARFEAKKLMTSLGKLLTEGVVLETAARTWAPTGPDGKEVERNQPTKITDLFPFMNMAQEAAKDGKSHRLQESYDGALRTHLEAEAKLAAADYPGAINDFAQSGLKLDETRWVNTDEYKAKGADIALSLLYLADAVVGCGYENRSIETPDGEAMFDVIGLYGAAAFSMCEAVGRDHPAFRFVLEQANEAMIDAGEHEMASTMTKTLMTEENPKYWGATYGSWGPDIAALLRPAWTRPPPS